MRIAHSKLKLLWQVNLFTIYVYRTPRTFQKIVIYINYKPKHCPIHHLNTKNLLYTHLLHTKKKNVHTHFLHTR